ncbi:MAG: serine/threonine protein kinase [Burkholderiales bacterium]|nr:serine/threonine protein kinase [Burkholderiales bacterium]
MPSASPNAPRETPYAGLTPDAVIDALESVGLECDGRLFALNSYENRVFQVGVEDAAPVIAKFYRPRRWTDAQILEEHGFAAELAAAEVPVVAPLAAGGATLHHHAGFRFALFPRRSGRTPELEDAETLKWLGRYLGRIHAVGAARPFAARPALDIDTFGRASYDWLLERDVIPADLRAPWSGAATLALDAAARCYERAGVAQTLRIHGDCHPGNVLWVEEGAARGPHFVDLDDARTGPAVQDLWMLLPGERDAAERALGLIVSGYEDFRDFDDRELHLIEALRTLRLLHHAAWIAMRWDDPAFPAAFPWFAGPRYWEERILELKEQVAAMQEAPLRPAPPA